MAICHLSLIIAIHILEAVFHVFVVHIMKSAEIYTILLGKFCMKVVRPINELKQHIANRCKEMRKIGKLARFYAKVV